jgi:hypothetical protein
MSTLAAFAVLVPVRAADANTVRAVRQVVDADVRPSIDVGIGGHPDRLRLEVAANTQFVIGEQAQLVGAAELGSLSGPLGIDDLDEVSDTLARTSEREPTTGSAGRAYPIDAAAVVDFIVLRPGEEAGWHVEIVYTILPASL